MDNASLQCKQTSLCDWMAWTLPGTLPKVAMPASLCAQHSRQQTRIQVSWRKDDSEEKKRLNEAG